ncbi:SH3 domain-containing protein [Phyllobacterium sp. K27]
MAARPGKEVRQPAKTALREGNGRADIRPTPVPRPSVAVGVPQQNPVAAKPALQASLQRPQVAIGSVGKAAAEPPRGANMPGMAPSVVYARDRLVLRRSASQSSTSTGSVEKGREMRSYSKAGKWHHIAVPTTGLIGWVHEDMLIKGKHVSNTSGMTTGAISRTSRPGPEQVAYPPRPVGKQ